MAFTATACPDLRCFEYACSEEMRGRSPVRILDHGLGLERLRQGPRDNNHVHMSIRQCEQRRTEE